MRHFAIALVAVFAAVPAANAETVAIDLPGTLERTEVAYRCADSEIAATYYNAGSNALAVLRFGEQTLVMANVLAASGAKYAGGQYVWWTKGDTADLYDMMKGEDADPVSCAASQ
ncbi:MliC family protein [Nitratireductor sp. ZSWI3]|uniref:MliC family protein n=1 Tax=Nitratireductor sp. ZSWI3 TaxID=2966359 RepID=UPI0021505A4D|nr:MliC family protein [Nitratireductor sp. ZSWI3]MCR4266377.1 MliC family protein [Nitratireductor sp. ZSWI3]